MGFVGPSARQQIFLAREMEERGDLDAARLRLLQAVAMEPANAAAHEELGLFYRRIGEHDLALRHLARANRLDPTRRRSAAALSELGAPVQPARPRQ